jgi:hypothetical protein
MRKMDHCCVARNAQISRFLLIWRVYASAGSGLLRPVKLTGFG